MMHMIMIDDDDDMMMLIWYGQLDKYNKQFHTNTGFQNTNTNVKLLPMLTNQIVHILSIQFYTFTNSYQYKFYTFSNSILNIDQFLPIQNLNILPFLTDQILTFWPILTNTNFNDYTGKLPIPPHKKIFKIFPPIRKKHKVVCYKLTLDKYWPNLTKWQKKKPSKTKFDQNIRSKIWSCNYATTHSPALFGDAGCWPLVFPRWLSCDKRT